MERGGKKNDELNVFVRLKKECNRRAAEGGQIHRAGRRGLRTRPQQRRQRGIIISLHAQPRRSRRRHRRQRRIERGASVRASLPSSGPSRLSLSSPFLSLLLLRRRARSTSVTKPFPIFVHRRRGLRPRCDGNADAARSCMPRGRRRREAEDQPGSITE